MMRYELIAITFIAAFLCSPAYAENEASHESDILQRNLEIRQQETRIIELHKLLELDVKKKAVADPSARALLRPHISDQPAMVLTQSGHNDVKNDYFDLTNITVDCFSREDRPVCGRSGIR